MGKRTSSLADLPRLPVCYLCIPASLYSMRWRKRSFNGRLRVFPGLQQARRVQFLQSTQWGFQRPKKREGHVTFGALARGGIFMLSALTEGLGYRRRFLHSGHSQECLRPRCVNLLHSLNQGSAESRVDHFAEFRSSVGANLPIAAQKRQSRESSFPVC